jgi:hypothetical protein
MTEIRRTAALGRTADGHRVIVELTIEQQDGEWQTTEHETIPAGVRVSLQGETIEHGHREPDSGGQIVDTLAEITEYAPPWDADSVARLADLWRAHHLNDSHAGCAHQTVVYEDSPYGRRPSLELTEPCPVSGYRYGSAWLAADPAVTDAGVAELLALPWGE